MRTEGIDQNLEMPTIKLLLRLDKTDSEDVDYCSQFPSLMNLYEFDCAVNCAVELPAKGLQACNIHNSI